MQPSRNLVWPVQPSMAFTSVNYKSAHNVRIGGSSFTVQRHAVTANG